MRRGMGMLGTITPTIAAAPAKVCLPHGVSSLYAGWLKVERSTMDRMNEYRLENAVSFRGGWASVHHCSWTQPIETQWTTSPRCYALDLSLDSRKTASTGEFHSAGKTSGPENLGAIYMVPPERTLHMLAKRGHARSLRCFLDADLIEAHLDHRPEWNVSGNSMRELLRLGGGQIEWLLRRMYRELHEPDFATQHMVESLAQQLAVEIVRRYKQRERKPEYQTGGLSPWRLRLIRERVTAEQAVTNLGELANMCDMTVRHLSRAFRAETGQTIGKYAEGAMAERAQLMLMRGASVREVAAQLGYATSGSFSCAFRRATGLLPREVKTIRAS